MEPIKISEIVRAVKGQLIQGDPSMRVDNITTDSRKGHQGMFIALRGDNFDGNDFAQMFIDRGGTAVMAEKPVEGGCTVLVKDTKDALGELAAYYRSLFNIPVVAVTGSVGKTSTKDMIACVLGQKASAHKTSGNFNNEIGLPLTVFGLNKTHEFAVLEMGMNNLGEIARLTAIAKPSAAVITNIGTAHIGNLGSKEGILKAKLEILEGLAKDGIVVLNGDDTMLWSLKGRIPHNTLFYGIDNLNADIVAYDIILGADKTKFKVNIKGGEHSITINAVGLHHVYNAMAALIIGLNYELTIEEITKGIADFTVGSMRQQVTEIGGIKIIEDCYNASPQSTEASLKVLKQLAGTGRSIAVLGDMSELGDYTEEAHTQVGGMVAAAEIDMLVTIGNNACLIAAEAVKKGIVAISYSDREKAVEYLSVQVKPGDAVLFKASRVMHLEEISKALIEGLG